MNASQGKNPAQIAYQLAKVRGYTPANAVTAEQKMAIQQKGAQASRSLGGGGSKAAGLSAQALCPCQMMNSPKPRKVATGQN